MFNDQTLISQSNALHTLIILLHCKAIHGHGLVLLNASETEARIKHLEGFVSVSFFLSGTHETIGEYVQWRSPAHLANAFRRPEFFEHLRVLEGLASAEVGFYSVERIIAREDVTIGPLFSGIVALQVLKLPGENADAGIARIGQWGEVVQNESRSLRAVVVHADRINGKVALFIHHDGVEIEPVWYADTAMPEIDRGERMTRYTTVSAPPSSERPMRYVLTSAVAPKGREP
jgi:hypothetical protein